MKAKAYSNESKQDWATPRWFLEQVQEDLFGRFDLDVCAANETVAAAPLWIDKYENGLYSSWLPGDNRWCNPPWNSIRPWVDRAAGEEWGRTIFLVPAKTETKWFRALVKAATHLYFVYPRLNYWDGEKLKQGINVGSALAIVPAGGRKKRTQIKVAWYEARKPPGATR